MKVAMVGLVGRTNAGKSTIMNALVGEKVSIVSPVEQTTRNTIKGIVSDERGQLVIIDTPGLHKAVGPLGKLLNGMARASSMGVDILAVAFDASREPQLEDDGWMRRVAKMAADEAPKMVFVLNKRDAKPFHAEAFKSLWGEMAEESSPSPAWVETSAIMGPDGVSPLMDELFLLADEGELLFPEDIVTDYPRKLAIADTVREKMLAKVFQEVPHELGVLVKDIRERDNRWDVEVDIIVNREGQKGIVIGPKAQNMKDVRAKAQRELSEMFGVRVNLELWVKVVPNWMKNPRMLAEMGYQGGLV